MVVGTTIKGCLGAKKKFDEGGSRQEWMYVQTKVVSGLSSVRGNVSVNKLKFVYAFFAMFLFKKLEPLTLEPSYVSKPLTADLYYIWLMQCMVRKSFIFITPQFHIETMLSYVMEVCCHDTE